MFEKQFAAAEALLRARFNTEVRVTEAERLTDEGRRNLLLVCEVAGMPDGGPTSVILKQVERTPKDPGTSLPYLQRLVGDWAGPQFLEAITAETPHGPRFYGGDLDLGLIVLEDLGDHDSLVEPLMEGDATTAEQGLVAFAARLAAMHADTIGDAARYEAIARVIDPAACVDAACQGEADCLRSRANRLEGLLGRLGAPAVATGFAADVAEICAAIAHPGPFLAYIHSDNCLDNLIIDRGQVRLLDFEFGGFGHALLDVSCARMHFPTSWCANQLPAAVLSRVEDTYWTELARACPAALDRQSFDSALALMCGYWILRTLPGRLARALEADKEWGIATLRQRILAHLEAFIAAAEAFARLPALRDTAAALYPGFRGVQ